MDSGRTIVGCVTAVTPGGITMAKTTFIIGVDKCSYGINLVEEQRHQRFSFKYQQRHAQPLAVRSYVHVYVLSQPNHSSVSLSLLPDLATISLMKIYQDLSKKPKISCLLLFPKCDFVS